MKNDELNIPSFANRGAVEEKDNTMELMQICMCVSLLINIVLIAQSIL